MYGIGCSGARWSAGRHRQERTDDRRAETVPRQGPPEIRGRKTLPRLRPKTLRPASPALRPGPGARPQGQRRVHGPALPHPPPGTPPLGQRIPLVGGDRDRPPEDRPQALEEHPPQREEPKRDSLAAKIVANIIDK